MLNITIGTRTFKAPTNWAECTRTQAASLSMFIGRKIFATKTRHPEPPAGLAKDPNDLNQPLPYQLQQIMVKEWLKCDDKYWQKLQLTVDQFHYLLTQAAWVVDVATPLTPNFQYLEIEGKKIYFPKPNFENVTALEIAWLNVAWLNFTSLFSTGCHPEPHASAGEGPDSDCHPESGNSPDEGPEKAQALTELLAIVLRPIRTDLEKCEADHNWNGDIRQPLSEHAVKANEKLVEKLTDAEKNLILRYIEYHNNQFINEFSILFGKADDGEAEDWQRQTGYTGTDLPPAYPEGFGWEAQLRSIAKEGIFGNYSQVCQTEARQIWNYELQKYFDAKHQAKLIEASQKNT